MNGLEERISVHYNELPDQLKLAANFVMSHPFEVATRSMRSVAAISKLSPATYTRLARATGFHDYDELKTLCVDAVNHEKELSIHDRAERLQHDAHGSAGHFLFKQASASIQNVENLVQSLDTQKLDQIVEMLLGAKRVAVAGALASHGVAQYMAYLGSWCQPNWYLLAYDSHASGLYARDLTADDTVLMITKSPNSKRSIEMLQYVQSIGASVILITDNYKCPAIPYANHYVLVPTDSPQFFSSYVATTLVLETILGMLVMKGGDASRSRIASIEETNYQISEYWSG